MTDSKNPGKGLRTPRKVTPESLRNAALHYLERYASSSANLREVLRRRVLRAERFHDTDREAAERWIEEIIASFAGSGLLDDAIYAEGRVRSMFRQGRSQRIMKLELMKKGVDSDTIDRTLSRLEAEQPAPDRRAAIRYARRRRLGPYRSAARADFRAKDLAALARAGFDYDVARDVVDAEDVDQLEDEAPTR
jgi:regulatory protein